MPLYLRKSVNFGPFRVNLSTRGVGVSAGVRGFRIGTGPRGHYVHAGLGGVYYRANLGGRRGRRSPVQPPPTVEPATLLDAPDGPIVTDDGVVLSRIDSTTSALDGDGLGTLLSDLMRRRSRPPLAAVLPFLSFAGGGAAAASLANPSLGALGVALTPALALGGWLADLRRRNTLLAYELDPGLEERYRALCVAFDAFAACGGIWVIEAAGRVETQHQRKRNAGAATIIHALPVKPRYGLPRGAKSNLKPPALPAGSQTLYFLPDAILVEEGRLLGGVRYGPALQVATEPAQFIETGRVPHDARIVGATWRYTNRDGGPDRRFRDNRQVPVCLYHRLALRSGDGLAEVFQASRAEPVEALASAIRDLCAVSSAYAT